jgi:hypothetical protein
MAEGWKENISPGEKLVLIALCDQANDHGECFVLVSTLQAKCSMGERTIQENLKRLEARGLLIREFRKGRSTIFHLMPTRFRTPADSAPTPADSAPITITYPLPNHYLTNNPQTPTDQEASKPQAAQGKKTAVVDLPDWMPADLYADIVAHRKSLKCPVTAQAMRVVIELAEPLVASGQDLRAILNQSISNGWKGLFPIREHRQPQGQGYASNDPLASGRNWIDQVDLSAMGVM